MRATAQTKLFGVRIPVDPKILFGGLAALIAVMFWYNSRGDEETGTPTTATRTETAAPVAAVPLRTRTPASRRAVAMNDRGVLRLRPIDPTKGDIDPTLRLDLLARLQTLQPVEGGRSLFESAAQVAALTPVPAHPPIITPRPRPNLPGPGTPGAPGGGTPAAAIPLTYYGYVKPAQSSTNTKGANALGSNRGFFLDGDNVLVASEGELLKQRYMVVELTPSSARLEDTQIKQGQTLPVVVAAMP